MEAPGKLLKEVPDLRAAARHALSLYGVYAQRLYLPNDVPEGFNMAYSRLAGSIAKQDTN